MEALDYIIPGHTIKERDEYEVFWDNLFEEMIVENKYETLVSLLRALYDISLRLKKDDKNFNECVDIDFIKQKLEHKVFSHEDFNDLFAYWIDWLKQFCNKDRKLVLEDLKIEIVDLSNKYGYVYVLPYAYFELRNYAEKILEDNAKIN